MIAVVQRVRSASVTIGDSVVGKINHGLCVLASIEAGDTDAELKWVANKLIALRIFADGDKAYHLDVSQVGGGVLLVSNFTVAAVTAAGRRPTFETAMKPDLARPMFDRFVAVVRDTGVPVATGEFGADMIVQIENDGPSTFIVQSPRKPEAGR
ncbi:MAG: D-aminoacyl-tRNA deacylase [Tepidisphaeraceae bacterium]